MASSILELSRIISDAAVSLDMACKEKNLELPSLEELFHPQSEAFRTIPGASEAANILIAASAQITAMVLPPPNAIFNIISGHFKSAALRVCLEANVTEILREAGPNGAHIDDVAERIGINPIKLGRLMRYLATHHVYKELSPNVYTNNRISSMLDTGKSVKEITANPEAKHDNTPGFAALAGHHLDEVSKSSAYLWETLQDPKFRGSDEVTAAPFNYAFHEQEPIWAWLETPNQAYRQRRFDTAMRGVAAMQPADAILDAFDWKSLPSSSVVVDVGGGVGASTMPLAETYPNLKFIIQDRPNVIDEGKKLWDLKHPDAVKSGRVELKAHDFFTEQPVKNASVFLLKQIMHDWPNSYAAKILRELRKVAQNDTKLLLIDSIIPFTCKFSPTSREHSITGAIPSEAPSPLLANYGIANELGYNADLT
ncbi:O-methyltransferase, partial [Cyathus striatus]